MLAALIRAGAALAAAIGTGYVFGFRLTGGPAATAAFIVIALVLSLTLSLGADAMGSLSGSAEAAGQILLIPQLLVVMLSTGIAPAEAFPDWLGPFVRNQPVSQIAAALRGLADGRVDRDTLAISVAWCVGLLMVFGGIAVRVQRRGRS